MVVQGEELALGGPGSVDLVATQAWVRDVIAKLLKSAAAPQLPVGYIVTNDTGVNPGVELGYGTWVAFGAGGTLYGFSGVAPFDVAGASIGGLTHQHTYTDVPQHGHTLTLVNVVHHHAIDITTTNPSGSSGGSASIQGSNADPNATKNSQDAATAVSGSADNTGTVSPSTATASSLPPGVVVYHWKRTA